MSLPKLEQLKTILTKAKLDAKASMLAVVEAIQSDLKGYVPASRKINSKPLSEDVSLNATDVGAIGSEYIADIAEIKLTTTAWSGTEASVEHSLASAEKTFAFIITPAPGQSVSTWQASGVQANEPTASAFTFSCTSKPNEDITVNVFRIKAKGA